ncbi:MAG: phosphomethylpyrimidine synthase [Candidatus Cloacimonetes bacterium 4572_65]|nr:MAG: phosphomethylpyrimidine synthase [Candidatus Cloacimonetes bacterium 4572_65]
MTQMQQALKGIITPEMIIVAKNENRSPEFIRDEIAKGRVVIPKNVNHDFPAVGIGYGLKTKVNSNIGTSEKHCFPDEEIEKLEVSVKYGADSIMDLSTGGDLKAILTNIIKKSPIMVGTVPIYTVMSRLLAEEKSFYDMSAELLFDEIETQAKLGVDFITVHCGITQNSVKQYETSERLMGIVSRGGSLIKQWMKNHKCENPLYEQYDRLLDICSEYDVTLSLGDGMRPGAQADASDRGQMAELLVLGELVDRARARGIQVMVEGPGHIPLDQVEMNVKLMKSVCKEAPFYVLGPLVTDIASGYDHIVGAIGGALAAGAGVDFLCYVTPAEHLCLPTPEDVKQGLIATRIAAHAGDLVKKVPGAIEQDNIVSRARREFDWETIYNNSIDPDLARERKETSESKDDDYCTMCGKLCAVRTDRGEND